MNKLDRGQVGQAVAALKAYIKDRSKKKEVAQGKKQLFEEDEDVAILISLKNAPKKGSNKPIPIPLPHTIYGAEDMDICLIVKDPVEKYENFFVDNPVEGITKIIGVSQMRTDYKSYENKRDLCNAYDLFFADDRVTSMLHPFLGKYFFKRKKQPVPVKLKALKGQVCERLAKLRDSTFFFRNKGPSRYVKIGRTSFSDEELLENVMLGTQRVVAKLKGSWNNIRCISLKTPDSVALPIYNDMSDVTAESDSSSDSEPEAQDAAPTPATLKAPPPTEVLAKENEEPATNEQAATEEVLRQCVADAKASKDKPAKAPVVGEKRSAEEAGVSSGKAAGPQKKTKWSKEEIDKSYYESYAHLGIHESMLKDKSRTGTYRKAIMENAALFKDAVVLDVGAGTGILSYFACDAGAKKVYAVEASDFYRYTQKLSDANGYSDRIEVLHGKMEDVELPEKVDIIISEWMGYFLVYEAMLDAVIDARDKWLKPGGKMFPDRGQVFVTAFTYPEFFKMHVDWWGNVWGKDFTALQPVARSHYMRDAQIDCVPPDAVCTEDSLILDLDLNTVGKDDYKHFNSSFKVEGIRTADVHGVAAWFHVTFPEAKSPAPVDDIDVDTGLVMTEPVPGDATGATRTLKAKNSPMLNIADPKDKEAAKKDPQGYTTRTLPKEDPKEQKDPNRLSAAEEKVLAQAAIARNHKSLAGFKGTVLSTSPYHEPTHWGHTMFWFNEPVKIKQGQFLVGSLKAEVSQGQHRGVDVYVSWKNHNNPTHQQIRARSFKLG